MTMFFVVLIAFLVIVAAMSVGVIFANKPIKGSCGGLQSLGLKDGCEICGGNDEECEKEQLRQAAVQNDTLGYDATKSK